MKDKSMLLQDLSKNRTKWLMLFPAALVVILMCYIPMTGTVLAFKQYNYRDGIFASPWAGFSNFRYFFLSGKAWTTTRNTILYNMLFITVNNSLQIICAIMLSELHFRRFKRTTQSLMFLPYFISWVVIGAFVYNLFNYESGALNTLLRSLGGTPINVYSNPHAWIGILLGVSVFKNLGYGTVLYLAAVMNIDNQMYEAADMDGASIWQKIRHITIPCIRPTMVTLLLLSLGTVMKGDFQMFYQVVGNNPMAYEVTDVIDTFVTRSLLQTQEFGMTSAAGLYQAVFSLIFVLAINKIIRRIEPEYALF